MSDEMPNKIYVSEGKSVCFGIYTEEDIKDEPWNFQGTEKYYHARVHEPMLEYLASMPCPYGCDHGEIREHEFSLIGACVHCGLDSTPYRLAWKEKPACSKARPCPHCTKLKELGITNDYTTGDS